MSTERSSDTQVETTPEESPAEMEQAGPAASEERIPVNVEHSPPRTSQTIAVIASLFGALLTVPFAALAIPFGFSGFVGVAGGLFYSHSRAWLSLGTALILLGAIVSGAYGAVPPELMLVGIGATILGWDIGQHGIVIGNQLGRKTKSRRNQLVHMAISSVVIAFISTTAYAGYLFGGSGRHAASVVIVILGIVLLTWTFRG